MYLLYLFWAIQKMERAGTWDFMVSVLLMVQLLIFLSFFFVWGGVRWGSVVLFSVP